MSDSVKIMPRQPIEATFDGRDCYDNPSTVFIILDPDHWEADAYVTKDGWVEVSDPIVWDGTDEALAKIGEALPAPFECERYSLYELSIYSDRRAVGRLVVNARIRIVGDSFVILPPEVTP